MLLSAIHLCSRSQLCMTIARKTQNTAVQSSAFLRNRVLGSFECLRRISGSAYYLLAQKHEEEFLAVLLSQRSHVAQD